MNTSVYFYEPFSTLCKQKFGSEIIKLNEHYWEIIHHFPSMETDINAWKKYYEINDCKNLNEEIKWIINNWSRNMIENIC